MYTFYLIHSFFIKFALMKLPKFIYMINELTHFSAVNAVNRFFPSFPVKPEVNLSIFIYPFQFIYFEYIFIQLKYDTV